MSTYIFGYGSLLSRLSRHRTFVESELHENVELRGYQRILNACCGEYLVMNIQPNQDVSIYGIVAKVEENDFPALRERECGYDLIEVTDAISIDVGEPAYAFMMREPKCAGVPISYEYINTCLSDMPTEQHAQWLNDTVFTEDLSQPKT
jgi:gamma-glutamylcyclotransferase (GGCT)/AIG2-like uncharacterized protein YtfP